ncbi:MAG: hypothetical protein ACRBCK_03725 [Alphaproteobacteria bacterium]
MTYRILKTLSLFTLFTATTFIFSTSAYAYADRCPRQQVKTFIKAKRNKTQFFHSSIQGINDYLNEHNVLAFVQNPLSIELRYNFRTEEIAPGRFCVMLDGVKAHYIASPRIVMPSNFSRRSCEYKIILKHEKRHLKVHYDYHDRSVGKYETFLGRIARAVPVSPVIRTQEEQQEVENMVANYFAKEFYTQVNKSINEMYKLQGKIDSPQEYLYTGRKIDRCSAKENNERQQNGKVFYDR